MSVAYIKYRPANGRYIALGLREDTDLIPEPKNSDEAVRVLTRDEHEMVRTDPKKYRYDTIEITSLYEGVLSLSHDTFYVDEPDFDTKYPDLDNSVFIQPRFAQLPVGALIKVSINEHEIEIANDDPEGIFELKASAPGIFNIVLQDARCWATPMRYTVMCFNPPIIEQ
jgi:hypothetical protein